jgi:ABC1 atypical kinase-like domain
VVRRFASEKRSMRASSYAIAWASSCLLFLETAWGFIPHSQLSSLPALQQQHYKLEKASSSSSSSKTRTTLFVTTAEKKETKEEAATTTTATTPVSIVRDAKTPDSKPKRRSIFQRNKKSKADALLAEEERRIAEEVAAGKELDRLLEEAKNNNNSNEKTGEKNSMSTDLLDLMQELNNQVASGTEELLRNLTAGMEDKLGKLPQHSADEMTTMLADLVNQIEKAQQKKTNRQLAEIERRFVRPLENIAFSDVPLYTEKKTKKSTNISDTDDDNQLLDGDEFEIRRGRRSNELILMGKNSTLEQTRRTMRTKDILRNFNVAPFYYSIALLSRWMRHATYSKVYLLAIYKSLASVIKSNSNSKSSTRKKTTSSSSTTTTRVGSSGEDLQAGWKRTGEIAAKGRLAKQWAVLRRSAEIWAYFSSFYLKDRRITARYNSGKWNEAQFKAERSKLGYEVTQNLLRLGPTFIKVGQLFSTRLDLVPLEYINELKVLQDDVPGFSGDLAVAIIERELGKPITELFDEFNKTSLAAASLGQVHVARRGKDMMAVKVQRQYLRELFEVDLGQLKQVAIFADAIDLTSEGGALDKNTQRDWVGVFEENKRLLYEEIE